MKKLFLLVLLGLILLSAPCVRAQDDSEDEVSVGQSEDEVNNTNEPEPQGQKFEFKADGEQSMQEQLEQMKQQMEQQQAFQKNAIAICLIVAKSRMQGYLDKIQELLKATSDGTALYKKIQTEHIATCLSKMQPEEFQQLAQEINQNTFDIKNYEQKFMDLTISKFENPEYDLTLSADEQKVDEIAEEWEKEWRAKKEELDEEDILNQQQQQFSIDDYEPKLFGYSYKDVPSYIKFLIVLGVSGFVAGVIYFGSLNLNKDKKLLTKKQRKEAKKQN